MMAVVALLFPVNVYATLEPPCVGASSTDEMMTCLMTALEHAKEELERVRKIVDDTLDSKQRELMSKAREHWVEYKDLQCEIEALYYRGGSILPVIAEKCLERMRRDRIDELKRMLEH